MSFVSSSSASSGVEANRNSAEKLWPKKKDSTLKDLLFIDMAMASAEIEKSTLRSSKFRIAESRSDTMKTDQPPRNEFVGASGEIRAGPCGKSVVTPQLSRSNARSRATPIQIIQVKSLSEEHVGRALFANRFGMLCNCLGILPGSP